ncbi:Chitin deacetylase [Hypsizygus marmoreus]|uniref:chitin deacetylase n=1 Tax=Hypsizygus marmoreus TaxID=39966 RepID=A0A369K6X3_HYPMA|nr:Chitin deacetylase [Hypsizygus marmoreus]
MKFSTSCLVSVASIPVLVAAHAQNDFAARHAQHLNPRQASSVTSSTSLPGTSTSTPTTSAATTPVVPPTVTSTPGVPPTTTNIPVISPTPTTPAPVPVPTTTYTFSLQSTNPTAVPLTAIISSAPSSVTRPLDHTFTPGSVPTFLPGAPPLPNAAILAPASYPTLDRVPPIDSPEVQQWIKDVANSGVTIPNIPINNLGGCPNNTAAATDPDRCWWTCGGCTRPTDVVECPTAMSWGLTYDDGPSFYTSDLLNYLDQENLKSTFFVVGSRVISFPNILQTQYMGEHQIAVHTWSHPQLTTLTNEEIIAELGWSKKVIKDVLGVTPNMMRPPFGDIDDRVRAISTAMGLTPVMWTRISAAATFDTDDFDIHSGLTTVEHVLQNWENILGNVTNRPSGFIVLEHDLFQQAVEVATGYILPDALAHQPPFTIQPVITCLNKPLIDAYIETNDNKTNPPAASGGPVTLSSGAPGSVQATSGADNSSSNSAASSSLSAGLGLAFLTSVIGIAAGLAVIRL